MLKPKSKVVCVCVCVCVVYACVLCVCVWCTRVCKSTDIWGKGGAGESERLRVRQRGSGRGREISQLTLEPMYNILGKALPRATRTRPSRFKAEPRWLSPDFSPVWAQNVKHTHGEMRKYSGQDPPLRRVRGRILRESEVQGERQCPSF